MKITKFSFILFSITLCGSLIFPVSSFAQNGNKVVVIPMAGDTQTVIEVQTVSDGCSWV